eukprot:gnl/Carplike_NY0171/9768_a13680_117.p1 GENE.gnl/Carplike_NY0171/9768_a13680_117~~gnl/Carplike_NY0171/9768_a13680_117.p1  ORF type:complete len:218 (-),score=26.68 gnl/Carplike_NY0171/9768_a13680_117:50-703(-)
MFWSSPRFLEEGEYAQDEEFAKAVSYLLEKRMKIGTTKTRSPNRFIYETFTSYSLSFLATSIINGIAGAWKAPRSQKLYFGIRSAFEDAPRKAFQFASMSIIQSTLRSTIISLTGEQYAQGASFLISGFAAGLPALRISPQNAILSGLFGAVIPYAFSKGIQSIFKVGLWAKSGQMFVQESIGQVQHSLIELRKERESRESSKKSLKSVTSFLGWKS